MNGLERMRLERKVAIKDLVCGIISRRNYSRLLSDDIHLSLEVLSKLLDKLNIPFTEFSFYLHNVIMYENLDEVYFHELIRTEKYEAAYKKYFPLIEGNQFKTLFANKTIPLGIQLMKLNMGIITNDEALRHMSRIIKLPEILNSHILHDDDIEALFLYIRICDKQAKEEISTFAFNALTNNEFLKLTGFYEQTMTILQLIALKTLTGKVFVSNEDRIKINIVADIALKFHNKTKLSVFDIMLFQTLYDYIKDNDIKNRYIVFYYVASIIGSLNEEYVCNRKFIITKEDIRVFYDCLNDDEFIQSAMYERLFANGVI